MRPARTKSRTLLRNSGRIPSRHAPAQPSIAWHPTKTTPRRWGRPLNNDHTVASSRAFYYAKGQRIALSNKGTLSNLAGDLLGSSSETFSSAGAITAAQLARPYGSSRFFSGSIPTDYRFAGQHRPTRRPADAGEARPS